jgi:hypothetical protein
MTTLEQALELRQLAEKFSEGWHDGIKIDASDVMLLLNVANALEQQAETVANDGVRQAAAMVISAWEWANQGPTAPPSLRGWIDVLRQRLAEPVAVQAEPVAWLSVDPIGERYLTFAKPLDNDPAYPLYLTQQVEPVVVQKLEKLSPEDNSGNPSY